MITVVHGKFVVYLAWSQPFLYELISGIEARGIRCIVVCNRTENDDRCAIRF